MPNVRLAFLCIIHHNTSCAYAWNTRFDRFLPTTSRSSGRWFTKDCPPLVITNLHGRSCSGRSSRHYAEGWGRAGDTGFVAHDKKNGSVVGAVWLRKPAHKPDAPSELAFAVKPEHRRHGIGTALLTQLVRANPHESTISVSFVAGKPVLRLYERFGFKITEEGSNAIVMRRRV